MRCPFGAAASGEHSERHEAGITVGRWSVGFSSPIDRRTTTFAVAVVPARSRATEIVSASTAALDAAYAACFGVGDCATNVETVTIRPSGAAAMSGRNARIAWAVV